MQIHVLPAPHHQKTLLRNLSELYLHDFSEFDGADVNEHGLYEYPYIDHYWTEPERHPFIIWADDKPAGFALVRDIPQSDGTVLHSMAEFFILRKYRRSGVGTHAAQQLFARLPGAWQVAQIKENVPAQSFWRNVIGNFTHDNYRETTDPLDGGPMQEFLSEG
ncbi:MAG: GNAT family N-acetyltransferase [Anaerolineales bacterium]